MTVESSTNRAQYATNGTTGPFTVPFYFLEEDHLEVIYTDSDGEETTLTLTTDYSVTGEGDEGGGSITLVTAYAAGGFITILRSVPLLQETDYVDTDRFPAESHERALDRLTMIAQQIKEVTDRALVFAPSDTEGSALPAVAARADKLLAFDSEGRVTTVAPADGSSAALALDIASASNSTKGAGQVGHDSDLHYAGGTVGAAIPFRSVMEHGASRSNTNAQNKTALQAAITAANTAGGGCIVNPSWINDGYETDTRATWPSFSGNTSPVVVWQYGPGNTYAGYPTAYDGAQVRLWLNTPQTTTPGQHDGNGFRLHANWAPYFWVDNNADLTGARAATDNRRASYYTGINGMAVWMMGQGTLDSATATDRELSNWHLRLFGSTFGGSDYDALIVDATTGHFFFNTDSNSGDAAYVFKQRTLGYSVGMFVSLTTSTDVVLRTSNGSGDDAGIRNSAGDLSLRITALGDALTVTKANRRVTIGTSFVQRRSVPVYSASITPDATAGNLFTITATNGTAFTINAPTSPAEGQVITLTIRNGSGGALGAITWNAIFKMAAWTSPANGNSRSISFAYDGTNFVEISRTAADVPN